MKADPDKAAGIQGYPPGRTDAKGDPRPFHGAGPRHPRRVSRLCQRRAGADHRGSDDERGEPCGGYATHFHAKERRQSMKHLQFLIKPASSACNLRCQYCFDADIAQNRTVSHMGMMQPETESPRWQDSPFSGILQKSSRPEALERERQLLHPDQRNADRWGMDRLGSRQSRLV